MSRPDEGLIHQWLDGECTPEESARIEQLVATDPDWAAAVAEARGLIAASARIVGALDAVPHAIPKGSGVASSPHDASSAKRSAPRRLPAWAGLAATLALVAGTAYVLRERSTAPFAAPAPSLPAAMPPTTVPPLEPARTEDRVRAEAARRAEAGVAAASAERVQAPTAARTLAAPPASLPAPPPVSPPVQKSAPLASVQTPLARRAEPERILDSPNSISIVTETRFLAGCWRVTEPPALVGTLVTPEARAGRGDSLTIVLPQGEYRVRQLGDTLRGALTATRVPCEPPND